MRLAATACIALCACSTAPEGAHVGTPVAVEYAPACADVCETDMLGGDK